MRRLLYSLTVAAVSGLAAQAATPTITNIANFPSLSVAYTNYIGADSSARLAITHTGAGGAALFSATRPFLFNGAGVSYSNSQQLLYPPFAQAPIGYYTNLLFTNIAAGVVDLYTVPAGKKFFLWAEQICTTNATSGQLFFLAKTNGVYYKFTSAGLTTSTNGNPQAQTDYLWESTETLSVTNTRAGASLFIGGAIFDADSPLSANRFVNFAVGDNTVYTVPANKTLFPYQNNNSPSAAQFTYQNYSGVTVTGVTFYIVPPGLVADNSTAVRRSAPIDTGSSLSIVLPPLLAGTSVVVKSSSNAAGQMCYLIGGAY